MGSDFYSYDQESRCKTSCTTIYKLGAKWRFEKNGRWMKLRKTKMVSTLELVSQHSLMMTIWSKKFFKFWHTRMTHFRLFLPLRLKYFKVPAITTFESSPKPWCRTNKSLWILVLEFLRLYSLSFVVIPSAIYTVKPKTIYFKTLTSFFPDFTWPWLLC